MPTGVEAVVSAAIAGDTVELEKAFSDVVTDKVVKLATQRRDDLAASMLGNPDEDKADTDPEGDVDADVEVDADDVEGSSDIDEE